MNITLLGYDPQLHPDADLVLNVLKSDNRYVAMLEMDWAPSSPHRRTVHQENVHTSVRIKKPCI